MSDSSIAKRMRIDPPVVEQTAELFVLNIDCMENIFDYLELEDVCAIGMTCRRMQQVAGKYFEQFYPLHQISIDRNEEGQIEETMAGEYLTNFSRFTEDLEVIGNDIDVLRYAVENMSKSLKCITLRDFTEYSPINEEYVSQLVQDVECLMFAGQCNTYDYKEETRYGDDSICYDSILKHCEKLKCLKFSCDWNFNIREKYPQLEHLIIKHPFEDLYNIDDFDMSKLKYFLEQNVHIRKLRLIGKIPTVAVILDLFREIDLKLDELSAIFDEIGDPDGYDHDNQMDAYCGSLDALHRQGKYKKLEVNFEDRHFFANLFLESTDVTKMEVDFEEKYEALVFIFEEEDETELSDDELLKKRAIRIALQMNLMCLRLDGFVYNIDAGVLSEELKKLEYLRLDGKIENGVLDSFVSQSPTLKEIIYKSDSFDCSKLKLATMNNNRQQLQNAKKLKIYLPEKDFLQMKWRTIELEYKFVEVKRLNESCLKSPLVGIMNIRN